MLSRESQDVMGEVLKLEMILAKKVVLEEVAHIDVVISTYFQPVF